MVRFLKATYLGGAVLILSMIVFVGWQVTHEGNRLAEGVTVEAIRAVKNGMTEEEVVAILGVPFERAPSVNHLDTITLTYSKPAYFAQWYPMLWVHLRNDRVFEVYAKRYIVWGSDDVGIYGAGIEPQWETALFEQTLFSIELN